MIKIKVGCVSQTVKQWVFPAGEVGIEIQPHAYAEKQDTVTVNARIKSSNDLVALLMVSDAIDRQYVNAKKILELPYIPYARQDRVCNEGEALSISVFASMINSCGFSKVKVVDPHSDVSVALIKNVQVTESYELLKKDLSSYYVVAPDAGAYKKAHKWAQKKNALGVITANKVRDVKTGKIISVNVDQDVTGLNLLVVDDLCDGGRTFTELADCLQAALQLELYVTHGIFSKGVEVLTSVYDRVYTTNSFHGDVPEEMKNDKINWEKI